MLKSRPVGIPQAEHFAITTSPLRELQPGELLVRNDFLSVDPAMRGWVNAAANYSDPVAVGEVMRSFAAGHVIASRHPAYAENDRVMGMLGWQEYAVTDGKSIRRKVGEPDLPLSLSLGVLGLNGVTAYFALTEVGRAAPRRHRRGLDRGGCGGLGGRPDREDRGVPHGGHRRRPAKGAAVPSTNSATTPRSTTNRRRFERDLAHRLSATASTCISTTPSGRISDAVLRHLAKGARVVICGTASVPSWEPWPEGPRAERHLLNKSARMQGFLIWDYEHRSNEAVTRLAAWIRSGQLRYREEILDGLETAPDAIAGLYRGENLGKRVIKVRHD